VTNLFVFVCNKLLQNLVNGNRHVFPLHCSANIASLIFDHADVIHFPVCHSRVLHFFSFALPLQFIKFHICIFKTCALVR